MEIKELFEDKDKLIIVNNSTNSDNATGGQHGLIINKSDKEAAEKVVHLMEKLIKNIQKEQ